MGISPGVPQLIYMLFLLCDAERKYLFVSDEPFQAIGISRAEFLRQIFALRFIVPDKEKVIEESVKLIVDHIDYPQTEKLTALVDFLKTPDLKEMTITRAKKVAEQLKQKHNLKKTIPFPTLSKRINVQIRKCVLKFYSLLSEL
jgi:hypothetical protein